MCDYYVKFKGFRGKPVVRERRTKALAIEYVEYLSRHGIKSKMGLIRPDGTHGKPQAIT